MQASRSRVRDGGAIGLPSRMGQWCIGTGLMTDVFVWMECSNGNPEDCVLLNIAL